MRHVIVTGGSSGIGAALAALCLTRGDRVSLIARTQARLDTAQEMLAEAHDARGRIFCAAADVADRTQTEQAIAACETAFGPCDLLITSAGIVEPGRFEAQAPEVFERQIATNLLGSANAARAVYAGMSARGRGTILLVSSGMGLIGIYGYTAYSASKFALHGFAEALRAEAAPRGVRVSICFPPDTITPQLVAEQALRPAEAEAVIGRVRPWPAEDVARLILRGLERGRFEIHFGFQLFALLRLGSLIKPGLNRVFDRSVRRVGK